MKERTRGVGVGTISLVMIFAVLCLTVFAMLTLSTSSAEKILADRSSSFVKGYYEADSRATNIRAAILESYNRGVFPASLDGVDIAYEQTKNAAFAAYTCEINNVQELIVKLKLSQGGDTVLEWRAGYSQDWEFDDSIQVWDGNF
jgi:hypothetical protein